MDTDRSAAERATFSSSSDAWMLRGGGIDVVVESPIRTEEMIQHLMESCTGARMHHSFVRVGGLKDTCPGGS